MITKFKIFETKIDLDSKYIIILVENAIKNVEKFRIPDDDAETYFDAKKYNL